MMRAKISKMKKVFGGSVLVVWIYLVLLVKQSINSQYDGLNLEKDPPRIALLISFPNSGTTFTLNNLRRASQSRTATHYCDEGCEDDNPWLVHKKSTNSNGDPNLLVNLMPCDAHLKMPKEYILTKTHCGGYCQDCQIEDFFYDEYDMACRLVHNCHNDALSVLNSHHVDKVVHLIRDPFDNIVARFRFRDSRRTIPQGYARNATGFRAHCSDIFDKGLDPAQAVFPCFKDLVQYVIWHNYANEFIEKHAVQSMTLHYRDYQNDWKDTTQNLLNFLSLNDDTNLEIDNNTFHMSNYSNYFTEQERLAAKDAIQALASDTTWSQLQRYFE